MQNFLLLFLIMLEREFQKSEYIIKKNNLNINEQLLDTDNNNNNKSNKSSSNKKLRKFFKVFTDNYSIIQRLCSKRVIFDVLL